MREFFRGWRRKIGVMTLVMACVFVVGWIRSMSLVDFIDYIIDERTAFHFHSVDQSLLLVWLHDRYPSIGSSFGTMPLSSSDELRRIKHFRNSSWRCCGFAIGHMKNSPDDPTESIAVCIIPYLSIVIPLTLLSAYLLLSKPRVAKPPESTKTPDEAQVTNA